MNEYNPYQPPTSADFGAAPVEARQPTAEIPESILESLRQTRPWVIFMAVLGFLNAGLLVLMGLVVMVVGSFVSAPFKNVPIGGVLVGLFYMILGVIPVVPSILLVRYGTSIGRFLSNPEMDGLADVVARQKSFWRFVGIATAVLVVLYFIGFFVGVVAGVAGAVRHAP